MALKGRYYDGQSPRFQDVRVELNADGLLVPDPPVFEPRHIHETRISSRLGNTARTITFCAGDIIETDDHATLDQWQARYRLGRNLVHGFESRFSYVLGALACVALLLVSGAIWGVPWVSKIVAHAVPDTMVVKLGTGTLNSLDKTLFNESSLEPERREALSELFTALLPEDSDRFNYNLVFRDGGFIGANAFALPDGTVIITDQLVALAEHDEEIASILLHEIGHVVHRHGLRQVISHAGLAALTSVIVGDISAAGTMVIALPNILMESSYSRDMEWEADGYALEKMQALDMPPERFADFFERLENQYALHMEEIERRRLACEPVQDLDLEAFGLEDDAATDILITESQQEMPETADHHNEQVVTDRSWFRYLSTHPPSAERIARFRDSGRKNAAEQPANER